MYMKTKLSDRVRPNVEVADWVHTEIKDLEHNLHELTIQTAANSGWAENETIATARYMLEDITDFIEDRLHSNNSEPTDGYHIAMKEMLSYIETLTRTYE
jgi:hypothetical protein